MKQTLGTIIFEEEKIILNHNEGKTETFEKDKGDYKEGCQWIEWNGDRYFLQKK